MDREHVGAEEVGKILIPTDQIMSGEPLEGWFPLIVSSGGAEQGAVHIAFQLFPPLALSVGKVLEGGYFQVEAAFECLNSSSTQEKEGCRVTMYQDADTPALPCFQGVTQPDGSDYLPTR